ncbi:MAG: porin family protein [Bacteroidota bacterium]
MSKKLVIFSALLFLLLSVSINTNAQKRKVLNLPAYDQNQYHFGFILGINHMLFTVKPVNNLSYIKWDSDQSPDVFGDSLYVYSVTSTPTPGFSVGILANLRLGKYTDLRFIPSLLFGERIVNYNILRYKDGIPLFVEIQKSITSTIIEVPLEVRYKSKRLNNFRAYVLTGLKYSLDLASKKKETGNQASSTVKLNRNDLSVEAGVGFEFYTTYFKFGTELKMGYGLNNLIVRENNIYSGSIDQINSKVFLLSFTFE